MWERMKSLHACVIEGRVKGCGVGEEGTCLSSPSSSMREYSSWACGAQARFSIRVRKAGQSGREEESGEERSKARANCLSC
jgi:hypothetical protein